MDEKLKQNTAVEAPKAGYSIRQNATDYRDTINQMYDAQKAQREAELKSAYDQSMSAQKAAQEKIAPQFQTSANDLATQYERNRRNYNMQAAGNGINTGTASQAALAQNNEYLRAFGNLRATEGEAQAAAERQMADLTAKYQSEVASALGQNDINRAKALFDEANNAEQRDLQRAQILAQFGDFSGFGALYGQEQAEAMGMLWAAQNPDLAYNTGRITADQYFVMTGKRPAGFTASGGKTLADLVDGYLPKASGGGGVGGGSQYVPLQPGTLPDNYSDDSPAAILRDAYKAYQNGQLSAEGYMAAQKLYTDSV